MNMYRAEGTNLLFIPTSEPPKKETWMNCLITLVLVKSTRNGICCHHFHRFASIFNCPFFSSHYQFSSNSLSSKISRHRHFPHRKCDIFLVNYGIHFTISASDDCDTSNNCIWCFIFSSDILATAVLVIVTF